MAAPKQLSFMYQHPTNDGDILALWDENPNVFLTRRQIADRIFRKPHKALTDRIERLVGEGKLERRTFEARNKTSGFCYIRINNEQS